jgi:hypothetical protein
MNTQEIAKKLAVINKMPKAEKYDLFLREYDHSIEVLGYVEDPHYDMADFEGREMLFPKRWVTIGVLPFETEVPA